MKVAVVQKQTVVVALHLNLSGLETNDIHWQVLEMLTVLEPRFWYQKMMAQLGKIHLDKEVGYHLKRVSSLKDDQLDGMQVDQILDLVDSSWVGMRDHTDLVEALVSHRLQHRTQENTLQ